MISTPPSLADSSVFTVAAGGAVAPTLSTFPPEIFVQVPADARDASLINIFGGVVLALAAMGWATVGSRTFPPRETNHPLRLRMFCFRLIRTSCSTNWMDQTDLSNWFRSSRSFLVIASVVPPYVGAIFVSRGTLLPNHRGSQPQFSRFSACEFPCVNSSFGTLICYQLFFSPTVQATRDFHDFVNLSTGAQELPGSSCPQTGGPYPERLTGFSLFL